MTIPNELRWMKRPPKEVHRPTLIKRVKLWCPTCQSIERVTDWLPLGRQAFLECGHVRPMTL
jgi:hypothetical protein